MSRAVDPAVWEEVRPFVLRVVHSLELSTPSTVKNTMREVTALAVWCFEVGLPLEAEVVFHPDTVDRFDVVGLADASDAVKRTYGPNLRRIGRKVVPHLWPPERRRNSRPWASKPYSSTEISELLLLAAHQRTRTRRRRLQFLLNVGLGAGLRQGEYADIQEDDFSSRNGVVLLAVQGANSRIVPVLEPYGQRLLILSTLIADEYMLGPSPDDDRGKVVTRILETVDAKREHTRIEIGRLRTTWLAHHIRALGFDTLVRAAGLTSSAVFFDLVRQMPPADADRTIRHLRGHA